MLLTYDLVADQYPGCPFITLAHSQQTTLLNILTIENAQDLLLSSVRAPFGNDQGKIAALVQASSCGGHAKGTWMLLYTNCRRYWLPLDQYQHTIRELDFRTPDLEQLRQASEDESLERVQIFVDGQNRAGMSDIRFEHVDLEGGGPSRIGSRIKLPIGGQPNRKSQA